MQIYKMDSCKQQVTVTYKVTVTCDALAQPGIAARGVRCGLLRYWASCKYT